MNDMGLYIDIKRIIMAVLAILFFIFFCFPASAAEGTCKTSCKDGPKEYGASSKWRCEYYTGRGVSTGLAGFSSREREIESSECILRIEGRFRNVDNSNVGQYKNFDDCFKDFCVPKVTEICGIEDRCTDIKNWIKSGERRFQ